MVEEGKVRRVQRGEERPGHIYLDINPGKDSPGGYIPIIR